MARRVNEDGSVTVGILEDVKSEEVVEKTASSEEKPKKEKPRKK